MEEKTGMSIRETNRLVVIPESFYAGGLYRMPKEIEIVEWERVYKLESTDELVESIRRGGINK